MTLIFPKDRYTSRYTLSYLFDPNSVHLFDSFTPEILQTMYTSKRVGDKRLAQLSEEWESGGIISHAWPSFDLSLSTYKALLRPNDMATNESYIYSSLYSSCKFRESSLFVAILINNELYLKIQISSQRATISILNCCYRKYDGHETDGKNLSIISVVINCDTWLQELRLKW